MKTTTMGQLGEIHQSLPTDEIILDVRNPDEFAEGHIPGATNIPHDQVLQKLDELKSKKAVYIHCRSGGRAQKAFSALSDAGLTSLVCIADGGFLDWAQAGMPVEKGN